MRSRVGRYIIQAKLGQGGMGMVYKAYDPMLDRVVAVKLMPPELSKQEKLVKRFLREARISAKLDHPNIVKVFDLGVEGDTYFLVMEYIDGITMRAYITNRERIDLEESLNIFKQILAGMRYAHSKGIIHRDLKPENVMITHTKQVKIMDFGLAFMKGRHSITSPGSVMGTLAYFSPEQARGEDVDQRTDVYALGVILYELLTGKLPIFADNPAAMINALLTSTPPSPKTYNPQIPDSIEEVIMRALSKEPSARYDNAGSMLIALERAISYQAGKPKVYNDYSLPTTHKTSQLNQKSGELKEEMQLSTYPTLPANFLEKLERLRDMRDIISDEHLNLNSVISSPLRGEKVTDNVQPISITLSGLGAMGKVCKVCNTVNLPNAKFCKTCGAPLDITESVELTPELLVKAKKLYQAGKFSEVIKLLLPTLGMTKDRNVIYMVVRSFQHLGEKQRALELLEVKLPHIKSKRLLELAGDLAYELKQYERAAEYYEKLFYRSGTSESLYKLARATAKFDIKRAIRLFEKLLELSPDYSKAKRYLAELCIEAGDLPRAVLLLQEYIADKPDDTKAYLKLAKLYRELGMLGELSELYMQVLGRHLEDPQLLYQIAKYKLELGEKSEALQLIIKAAELAPEDIEILQEAYLLARSLGKLSIAAKFLQKISESQSDNPALFEELGDIYMDIKDYDNAVAAYMQAIKLSQTDVPLMLKLGDALVKANRYAEALDVYNSAYNLDHLNPKVLEKLSLVNHLMGNSGEAVRYLEEAVALDPKNFDYIKGLAKLLRDMGKLSDAARYLQMILDDRPNDAIANAMLGEIYARQGLTSSAIYYLKTALNNDVNLRWAQWLLIELYIQKGDYESALRELDILINILEFRGEESSELYKAWYKRCEVTFRQGNRQQALQMAQNYLNRAKGLYHYALRAFIMYNQGKPIESIEILKKALQNYMEPDLLELIADYRVRSGQHVKALKYVERLLESEEPKPFHFYLRGIINFQLNNFSQALSDLREAYMRGYRSSDILQIIVWLAIELKRTDVLQSLIEELNYTGPTSYLLKAKALELLGRQQDAQVEYQKLKTLYPVLGELIQT